MNSGRTISELIGLIYDAAGDAARWPAFLEPRRELLRGQQRSDRQVLCASFCGALRKFGAHGKDGITHLRNGTDILVP